MRAQCDSSSLIYNNYRCYIPYINDTRSWLDAQLACQSLGTGSSMAFIKDSNSQMYLEQELSEPISLGYWIGAREAQKWMWDYSKKFL